MLKPSQQTNSQASQNTDDVQAWIDSEAARMAKLWTEFRAQKEDELKKNKKSLEESLKDKGIKLFAGDEGDKKILVGLSSSRVPGGGQVIYNDKGQAVAMMDGYGSVSVNPELKKNPESPEYLDALMRGATAYKSVHGANAECMVWDREMGKNALIEKKAYELAGLHVVDDMGGRKLEDVDPALAKRMEEMYANMKPGHAPDEKYSASTPDRGSVSAKVDGLAQNSPFTGMSPLKAEFASNVVPPAPAAMPETATPGLIRTKMPGLGQDT